MTDTTSLVDRLRKLDGTLIDVNSRSQAVEWCADAAGAMKQAADELERLRAQVAPAGEAVASIYISPHGEREIDDWKCKLPPGRHELFTAAPAQQANSVEFDGIRSDTVQPSTVGDEPRPPSPTAGMTLAQRILHVGGRNNAAGYVEFGSTQAVEALVRQVLRDLPAAQVGRTNSGDETGGAVKRFGLNCTGSGSEIIPATNGAFVWYDDYLTLWRSKQAQAAAQAEPVAHISNVARWKVAELVASGYRVCGYTMEREGHRSAVVFDAAVRWLTDEQRHALMFVEGSVICNPPAQGVEVPPGLARSDAEFWLRHRAAIITALRDAGLSIVSTANGVSLMRLPKPLSTFSPAGRGELAGDGKPCPNEHDPDCRWPNCNCRQRDALAQAQKEQL